MIDIAEIQVGTRVRLTDEAAATLLNDPEDPRDEESRYGTVRAIYGDTGNPFVDIFYRAFPLGVEFDGIDYTHERYTETGEQEWDYTSLNEVEAVHHEQEGE